ncbi:hypothetical protein K490DRAFT_35539 [Saccharata proteae CBS 121410]|uniref:Uncharacterized protein n=1 Tax=Saccharata proteae CBS 121410 TaxID=1314787 RepID=A0A9P4M1S1_9PEZI|nr:hypothetical protein K490DRAFT_35539 [Saccharata proteae CBS 121410]
MRFSQSLLIALPAVALAQEQAPLADKVKGWFNKATSYVSSVAPAAPSPVDAGAAKVAELVVEPLTLENWHSVLAPTAAASADGPEEWMIYVTGGNATCYGLCGNTTEAWNRSTPLLSASPNPPHLAVLDCETEPILCNSWAASAPSVVHMLIPAPLADQSKPATTVRFIPLNRTSTTAGDITAIHTEEKYKKVEPYEGIFHPFDGQLAQYGVAIPVAYVFWGFSKMPSWLPMIAISFLSRTVM